MGGLNLTISGKVLQKSSIPCQCIASCPSKGLQHQPTYIIQESDHIHRLYSDDLAGALEDDNTAEATSSDPNLPATRKNFQLSESLASLPESLSTDKPLKSRGSIRPPTQVLPRPCRCPISTLTTPPLATDFVFAPLTLERLIITGFLLCLDSLLFMCTILPIRFMLALFTSLRNIVVCGLRLLPNRRYRCLETTKLHAIQKIDLFRILVLISAAFLVQKVQVSFFIAFIKKGLSKMRMMVMFVEVIERVLINFGSTILGSAFWRLSQADTSKWRFLGMYVMGPSILAFMPLSFSFICVSWMSLSLWGATR